MNNPKSLDDLLRRYFRLQHRQILANRRQDIPAYNRIYDRVWYAMQAIEDFGGDGKQAIEAMLEHDEPMIRFRAAERVQKWNPDLAIPVLGRLLIEPFPEVSTGFERFSIHVDAKMALRKFFELKEFNQNALIEPLKAYGIDLPRRPEQIWLD